MNITYGDFIWIQEGADECMHSLFVLFETLWLKTNDENIYIHGIFKSG